MYITYTVSTGRAQIIRQSQSQTKFILGKENLLDSIGPSHLGKLVAWMN